VDKSAYGKSEMDPLKQLSNIKVDCTYDMLVIIESLDVVVFISVAL
jgi:hypothetical protein